MFRTSRLSLLILTIALGARQEHRDAFSRAQCHMLNLETHEFVAAEPAPKSEEHKCAITQRLQFGRLVFCTRGRGRGLFTME